MGNLGFYQLMTTAAKKVGGPKRLILLVAIGGYGVFRGAEAGIKGVAKVVKHKKGDKIYTALEKGIIYEVTSNGIEQSGLELNIGDKFKVIARDEDAVLIEKLGSDKNPYFVSGVFLETVSAYKEEVSKHDIKRANCTRPSIDIPQ